MATTADKPIQTIAINGFTGREPIPDDDAHYLAWKVARHHNAAVPAALEEEQAWNAYTSAETATEHAWQALDTTPTSEWAAAHHRWVKAEHALSAAASQWHSAATAMDQAWEDANWSDRALDFYAQAAAQAGVRELLGTNRPTSSHWVHLDVERRRREREQLAGKTLQRLPT
ncbi:hypothetical protein ACQP2T_61915 [Nonomuraea sp. CA-143628]|uniref:hypothetical protein n=1 Tax=Nonomuraea sp. CA-143628 TaxID=3239997 RepID=UPI003D9491FA